MILKLTTVKQTCFRPLEAQPYTVGRNWISTSNELTFKILSRVGEGEWGWDGLNGNKANLSPAKLKLADIGLEMSLAIKA